MSVFSPRPFLFVGTGWLVRRVLFRMGLRRRVPRPKLLRSRFVQAGFTQPSETLHALPRSGLKVLVFSHNLNQEGAPISLMELVIGLVRRGEIQAEVLTYEDGPLRAKYEEAGISVTVLPQVLHKLTSVPALDEATVQLADVIRKFRPQVVFANTLLNFLAVLAAERAGVPSVWNPRESEPWDRFFCFLPEAVAQRAIAAMGLPRRVVFVARATRKVWADFEDECRFTVIHNALNPARFAQWRGGDRQAARKSLGWHDDEIVFLCTGTVCERKGQKDAVSALESIRNQLGVKVRLVLCGDASRRYARDLRRRTSSWKAGCNIRVDLVDATADMGRFYLASDVFVLCSRMESYPRVVLEALTFGLPIITTRVFGVAEQLPDPRDASFYEPGDVSRLGEHLLELASRSSARECYARRSRLAQGQMESFDEMCRSYSNILRSCCMLDDGTK